MAFRCLFSRRSPRFGAKSPFMHVQSLLDTPVGEVETCGILSLFEELEMIAPVSAAALPRVTLWQYLTLCVYPGGVESRRQKLSGASLPDSALLNTRLRMLERDGSALFVLCEEIARRNRTSAELYLGDRLFNYLNKQLPKFEVKRRGRR